jgi:hypothetical protein
VRAFKVASCEVSVKVTSERILFLILPRATGFVVPKSRSCKNRQAPKLNGISRLPAFLSKVLFIVPESIAYPFVDPESFLINPPHLQTPIPSARSVHFLEHSQP